VSLLRQHILLSYLKTRPRFEPATSRTAVRCSTNWANRSWISLIWQINKNDLTATAPSDSSLFSLKPQQALPPLLVCMPRHSLPHRTPRMSYMTSLRPPSAVSPAKYYSFFWVTSALDWALITPRGPQVLDSSVFARWTTMARDYSSYALTTTCVSVVTATTTEGSCYLVPRAKSLLR